MKSYFVFALSFAIGLGGPFCGMQTPFRKVLVVDYEDEAGNFRRRMKRIARGYDDAFTDLPPIMVSYWDARGIPFKDQVDAIKRKCEKDGVGLIVIDSAGPACGGPPEDAVAALAFFRALKKIGLPSIVIAHITKGNGLSADNTQKPFGSVYWHNEARRTWYVSRVQEEDSDELDIGLFCKKVNDGRMPAPLAFHVSFDGTDGPVTFGRSTIGGVPELLNQTSIRNRIWETLARGGVSIKDICESTGLTDRVVKEALRIGPFYELSGVWWRRQT